MNSSEFKKGKQLKVAHACSLIQNIFKEKVILQQINCKSWQWKAVFSKPVSPPTAVQSGNLSYDTKVLRHWHQGFIQ